jgi:two-component system, chemotaxis family, protein-glutamate methylesterase/glutaminase
MKNKKIRVLVADDSFFMKRLLGEILDSDESIEVVGKAKDGKEAVEMAINLKPDVITMDYNMPFLNGAEAIREILGKVKKQPPAVIMISAYTKEGADETIECLRSGAVDFIAKPSGELSLDIDKIADEIIKKVYSASRAKVRRYPFEKPEKIDKVELCDESAKKIVVIGSSTGGPPLVEDIVLNLPSDLNAAVLLVQHMPSFFIKKFSARLNKLTSLHVSEAKEGDNLSLGSIFMAPSDAELGVIEKNNNRIIKFSDDSEYLGPKPSINAVMESCSKLYKNNAVGVILTGMGVDGTKGAELIKKSGGYIIAQDPETAVIDSMPNSVIDAGIVDEVLSPEKIVKRIIELTK